jgi:hypothetical protein
MPIDLKYRASDDLLIAAQELYEAGSFGNCQDVIDFFEKPWKWKNELKEIMELKDDET